MQQSALLFSFIALSAIFTIIGDVLGKQWVITNKIIYFLLALSLMLISCVFFLVALKYGKLGIVSVVWDAVTSLFLILAGYLIFKEGLTSVQITAVILIFISLFLLAK
jgi:multidrug transporter EmrE-like cation transporter